MYNFYWYPKCSTCKRAKVWLDEHGISYNTIDMVETPPTKEQLMGWMAITDLPVRRFFNTSGVRYREQGLKDIVNDFSHEEAADRLKVDGMLIKRPILEKPGQPVVLGFKEAAYEELTK
ncbi:arsenate reductase family protein [Vagococcus coleopterorum]|uniref:Arsenate reductase family protein n=1 Tax=Vagococcus coleopterorum TaxID=2714946 RepID=A0A6G8APJ1_9ENTE|nr:arsenate reductase family protein [Vagococcus coleopterorum]QIL46994.1 arsenate reductase family protein [Vagococcus coleopterorum]